MIDAWNCSAGVVWSQDRLTASQIQWMDQQWHSVCLCSQITVLTYCLIQLESHPYSFRQQFDSTNA